MSIHQYTSSLFVQSGAIAEFKSGLAVSESVTVIGSVTANFFEGDGSGITGLASANFFAGSGSGISQSTAAGPASIDHVIDLGSGQSTTLPGTVNIQTTQSAGFDPNYYSFIKITDTFTTLQTGSDSSYLGTDRTIGGDDLGLSPFTNDLAPGVHRYLVYATNTGSSGETNLIYSTVFIKGFFNVPPEINISTPATISLDHDASAANINIHFTGSSDQNTNDFIREYSASRTSTSPTIVDSDTPSYAVIMKHPQSNIAENSILIATGTRDPNTTDKFGPGALPLPDNVLVFTASISNYNLVDEVRRVQDQVQPQTETFTIKLTDNNLNNATSTATLDLQVKPPPTASIDNIEVQFENNSFTEAATNAYETTILYDNVDTLTSTSSFHEHVSASMYTQSLVRLRVKSDITEPDNYETLDDHLTTVKIFSSSAGTINSNANTFKYFRFRGNQTTASNYGFQIDQSAIFTNTTGSSGYTPFSFGPQITFFGPALNVLDHTGYIRHGDNNHFVATAGPVSQLTINQTPNIDISSVVVEVESGSFLTDIGYNERTASILYGFTSSLNSDETLTFNGYTKGNEYISSSVIRVRLLATITEPFGPHHAKISSSITSGNLVKAFEFHTGSAEQTASATHEYNSDNLFVGRYTSSWAEFKLSPGEYTFSASFASETNAGRTIAAGTHAEVSVSATVNTDISNIVYETETFGYSYTGSVDTQRTVLYGTPSHTIINSSSFKTHPSASLYASHSVTRFRIRAEITEPFGPHHTASRFDKLWTNREHANIESSIIFSTNSLDIIESSSVYGNNHRLISQYTSSWIGQQLSSSAVNWTYQSGSILHTSDDLSEFNTTPIISTQIKVNDTDQIEMTDRFVEFEEYGYSASNALDTGVGETSRTVLYGSNHESNINSSSFKTHPSASLYASHSVTRFRVRFKVAEPVGPVVSTIQIPLMEGVTEVVSRLTAETASLDFESINQVYDSQKRLTTHYTSSWIETQCIIASENYGTSENFEFQTNDSDITSSLSFENGIDLQDETTAVVTLHDTVPTQIANTIYEVETFGYSNNGILESNRKVLYGIPHHTAANSESFANHVSASTYASQSVSRFRIRTQITEPVGPLHHSSSFEKVWTADGQSTISGQLISLHTGSSDLFASHSIYDNQSRLITQYTSSWIGQQLSSSDFTSGVTWKYTSGSIQHKPLNENKFTTASGDSTIVAVFDTQPTIISLFKTETETFGYSYIGASSAQRTVLYGISNTSEVNSSSYATHPSASLFASQSVSRFRFLARIIEPVGPLQHTGSIIEKQFVYKLPDGSSVIASADTQTIFFNTGSSQFQSSHSFFTELGEFVTDYSSSWIGTGLSVTAGPESSRLWHIGTGSITHLGINENGIISEPFTRTDVTVLNTPQTIIENVFIETEKYGYSGSVDAEAGLGVTGNFPRTVLYGHAHTLFDDSSSYETHPSASLYASQSVARFRIRTKIIEPVGPLHFATSMSKRIINDSGFNTITENIGFATSSIHVQKILIDNSNRMVSEYTTSFSGSQLTVTSNGTSVYQIQTGSILHVPTGETGVQSTSVIETSSITVKDTPATNISDIFIETEEYGHSSSANTDIGVTGAQRRTVLYGVDRSTEFNSSSYATHPSASIYASQSVSRFRVRAKIIEPVGFLHAPSTILKTLNASGQTQISELIVFDSSSQDVTTNIYFDTSNQLVVEYTSSFSGSELNVDATSTRDWTIDATTAHSPSGENGHSAAGTTNTIVTVIDTPPTQIVNYKLETETYGESGIGIQNPSSGNATDITRSILYGETTTRATGSDLADIYDPHAVTRFRILTEVIEPVGPLHHSSSITYYKNNEGNGGGGNVYSDTTIAFSTSSTQTASSAIAYDSSNRLVGRYTSSFIGEELPFSYRNDGDVQSHWRFRIFSSQVKHEPIGENGENASGTENLYFVVSASKPLEIEGLRVETEAFPYSSSKGIVAREQTILYGHNTTLSASIADDIGDIWSGSAALRFRVLGKIIEPIGLSHFKTQVTMSTADGTYVRGFEFHTGSLETSSRSDRELNDNNEFVTNYTSSFHDGFTFPAGNFEFTASAKSGSNTTGVYIIENSGTGIITGSVQGADVTVTDAAATIISNIRVEVEKTNSGSNQGDKERDARILHGRITSETNTDINNNYPNVESRNQLVSMRVLADIAEPFGPHHGSTDITVTGFDNIDLPEPDPSISSGPEIAFTSFDTIASHHINSYGPANLSAGTSEWRSNNNNSNLIYNIGDQAYEDAGTITHDTGVNQLWLAFDMLTPKVVNRLVVKYRWSSAANRRAQISGSNTFPYATGSTDWTPLHEPASDQNSGQTETYEFVNGTAYRFYRITFPTGKWENANSRGAEDVQLFAADSSIGAGSHTFTLFTGSLTISDSASLDYSTHGSQSVGYTSSFIPIEFINNSASATEAIKFNVSASLISHSFNDSKTISFPTINSASITIQPAHSASIFVTPTSQSTDNDFSHSIDMPTFVTYNADNNITINILSGITASSPVFTSESHVRFPNHLEIFYDNNGESALTFNPVKSSTSGHNTSSLTIASSDISSFTNVEHFAVNISASNQLSGNGSSSNESFEFRVVPAQPQSMHGKYWSSNGFTAHDTDDNAFRSTGISYTQIESNTRQLYKASLPSGLASYSIGDVPGTNVSNVLMAKENQTGPLNYSMSFTPFAASDTGNYNNNTRLFNFGDTGSLIVKINGVEVVNADLQSNFVTGAKNSSQDLSGYDSDNFSNGTASFNAPHIDKGRLILTKVKPFNNVSQSFINGTIPFENGYQGWTARIELDNKLNDGYNCLEFSHSIASGITSQSWQPFEWYYDDGIAGEPKIDLTGAPTLSAVPFTTEPTFSLSGVSFYKESSNILVSLQNRVRNIAHSTYRFTNQTSDAIAETSHDHNSKLLLTTGSTTATSFDHSLFSNSYVNGLRFDEFNLGTIPSASSSGSIENFKVNVNNVTNHADLKGEIYQLNFKTYKRNLNDADSWSKDGSPVRLPIGRFIDIAGISTTYRHTDDKISTDITEDFFDEEYRWESASFMKSASFNFNKNAGSSNYGTTNAGTSNSLGVDGYPEFWLRGALSRSIINGVLTNINVGPDFQSHVSIQNQSELQQQYDGHLIYPTLNYTDISRNDENGASIDYTVINPNAPDYSNESGDKFYCRAFTVSSNTPSIFIFTPNPAGDPVLGIAQDDIRITNSAGTSGIGIDDRNVRIDVALPGPLTTGGTSNSFTNPGTKFQNLARQKFKDTLSLTDDGGLYNAFGGYGNNLAGSYRIRANFAGFNPASAGNIMLMRIRIKAGFTGIITGIHVSNSSTGEL